MPRTTKKTTNNNKKPPTTTKNQKKSDEEKKKIEESSMQALHRKERHERSYAAVKKKWVDLKPIHWPLVDILHDNRCREVTEEGCKIIRSSLADCALLEGEERNDPVLLRLGIVVGHDLICLKTEKGVVCIDGNHKLAVYRDYL